MRHHLIELGYEVQPWTARLPDGRLPIVTGVFGGLDTMARIMTTTRCTGSRRGWRWRL